MKSQTAGAASRGAPTDRGQESRERLLEAATTLMRRSGLSGAGINEIVRESGAPKGSMYHYFPGGKQQIVGEALESYTGRVVAFIAGAMSARRTPATRVAALFEAFAARLEEGDFRHSCPAGTVCLDLDEAMEDLRAVVAGAFERYVDAIASQFPHVRRDRARAFASVLLTAIEGAYIRGRADRSGEPFREAGTWLAKLAESELAAQP